MTTTHTKGTSGKILALWLCAGLVGATAIMTQPVRAFRLLTESGFPFGVKSDSLH